MLRLPPLIRSLRFPSIYGSIGVILFFAPHNWITNLWSLDFSFPDKSFLKPHLPMVTGGPPVFPYFPILPLIWSQTPVESHQLSPTSKRWLDMAPTTMKVKASDENNISGLNTHLRQSLSTLHANIAIDYARLASGGWLLLSRQDLFTCREILRCFFQLIIYL